jgi:hypothetical protein
VVTVAQAAFILPVFRSQVLLLSEFLVEVVNVGNSVGDGLITFN